VLSYCDGLCSIIDFPRKELASPSTFFPFMMRLLKKLRHENYDMVIDLQGLFRSAFFAKAAKSKVTVGFKNPREAVSKIFYDIKIAIPPELTHAVEKNAFLVSKLLGIEYRVPRLDLPEISKNSASVNENLRAFNVTGNDICIGVIPGARWKSKKWPASFFSEIINSICAKSKHSRFILIGAPSDSAAAQEILTKTSPGKVFDMTGKTGTAELVELLRKCSAIITNDSGPMHIAAALNIPVLAFFGPTIPEKTGPFGKNHVILTSNTDCIGCLKRYCPDKTYKCHNGIHPADAVNKLLELIKHKDS
jgi:lipopolysaccharide heptosyltransferase II